MTTRDAVELAAPDAAGMRTIRESNLAVGAACAFNAKAIAATALQHIVLNVNVIRNSNARLDDYQFL
jgi:hypothetical protein